MATYQTEQRKLLLDYMTRHGEEVYSVDGWIKRMQEDADLPSVPGRSTIFRLMQKLVGEGLVLRFTAAGSRGTKYQIVRCHARPEHLHLKCIACGKLYHLGHEISAALATSIYADQLFNVDNEHTIIYGKCIGCK